MPTNKRNYQLLGLLIIVWGSSFLLIDRSLLFFSPEQIVGYRLFIGAVVMLFVSFLYGKQLPSLLFPGFTLSFMQSSEIFCLIYLLLLVN